MAITISGENNNDRITAADGVIDTISGFNISGIITASSFTGDLTGDVTGNLTGNVTGNINNSTLLLQTGGTERLRITSGGKISYNYDGSAASTVADVDIRTNSGVHIRGVDPNANNTNIYIGGAVANQRKTAIIHDPVGGYCRGDLHFCLENTADLSDVDITDSKMVIKADGKIGINSTSPTYALEVDGGTQNTVIAVRSSDAKAAISFLDNTSGGYGRATIGGEGDEVYITSGAGVERLRISSNGQIATRGATGTSFNNAGNGDFGSFLTVNGGHTSNQWGILSLEGNTSASGYGVGEIQFINQNNANGSSGASNQSRLLAKINVSSVTSDSNAGDDSGGILQFFTKPEAGQPTQRLIITSTGTVHTAMTGTAPSWLGNTIATREKFSVFQGANFAEACFNIDVDNANSFLSHNMYYDSGWKIKKSGQPARHLEIGTNGWSFMTGADGSDNAASALTNKFRIRPSGRIQIANNDEDIDMANDGSGQIQIDGNGYTGAIALNSQGMFLYHNSSSRYIGIGINETEVGRFVAGGYEQRFNSNTSYSSTTGARKGIYVFNDGETNGCYASLELAATNSNDHFGSTILNSISTADTNYSNHFAIQTRHGGNYYERLRIHSGGTVQVQNHLTSRNGIVQINQVTSEARYAGSIASVDLITGSTFTPKTSAPRFLIQIFCPVNTSDDSDAGGSNQNSYFYGRIEYRKSGGGWIECNNQGSTSNQGGSAGHIELSPNRTGSSSTTDYWSGNRYRLEHKCATILVTNVGDCGSSGTVQFKLRGYAQNNNFVQIGQPHGYGTDDNYPVQPWGFTVFELAPDNNTYTAY